jgi:hypothetical protein
MGARPPATDDAEPDVIEFGIAALDAALENREIRYPVDAETLAVEHGELAIPYDARGNTLDLKTALAACEESSFDHERDLLNALHPVFEERREQAGASVVMQLRDLIPF